MELPPAPSVGEVPDDDETAPYDHSGDPFLDGDETVNYEGDGGALTTTSSRFWGVSWDRRKNKWQAYYKDADSKQCTIGYYDDDEEAARAVNKAIRDAGLEGKGKRRMNPVDATGALVPRTLTIRRDRSAVVAPDPARDPSATTSKFWGVSWDRRKKKWTAYYKDADGKGRHIGLFDTQEAAAHAVNAAIRRAGLVGRRHINPVVDGRLVPKTESTWCKRRRDEPAATPSPRARRQRRVVNYAEDPDFEA